MLLGARVIIFGHSFQKDQAFTFVQACKKLNVIRLYQLKYQTQINNLLSLLSTNPSYRVMSNHD